MKMLLILAMLMWNDYEQQPIMSQQQTPKSKRQQVRSTAGFLYRHQFLRFCFVGGLGFIINAVLLHLFHGVFSWPLLVAQAVASEIALFHNFMWHHHWTYIDNHVHKSFKRLVVEFHASSWTGVIGSSLILVSLVKWAHLSEFVALVISSAILLVWNFVFTKYVVWRKHEATDPKPGRIVA